MRSPAAYSLSVSRDEMKSCQCGKLRLHRIEPLADARFPGVDLLPAAHEADDDRPVGVAVHAGDQEFRLRLLESGALLFAAA